MKEALVERVARAVLYEGYILYPYRPCVKNRQRWTFGGLYPEVYCHAQTGADRWSNQTECLIRGDLTTTLDVSVRFLHMTSRIVGECVPPLARWQDGMEPSFRAVECLLIGDRLHHSWQEAEERQIALGPLKLDNLLDRSQRRPFTVSGKRWLRPLLGAGQEIQGVLVREQRPLEGVIEVDAVRAADELFKVTLRIQNSTPFHCTGDQILRDEAVLCSLASTHAILRARCGQFLSLLDPPEECRSLAAGCTNLGTWPVLVGTHGQADTVLSSPIILYDYPQVAPESPGDLFDSTEIDEILSLRIRTLTDEEKRQIATLDERARALLERTEALNAEEFLQMHGTIRGMQAIPGKGDE